MRITRKKLQDQIETLKSLAYTFGVEHIDFKGNYKFADLRLEQWNGTCFLAADGYEIGRVRGTREVYRYVQGMIMMLEIAFRSNGAKTPLSDTVR